MRNYILPAIAIIVFIPLQASGQEASPGSSIHGFMECSLKNSYVTPRGLVVTTRGATLQPLFGLVFDLWQGEGLVNDVAVVAGTWNDINTIQRHPHARTWNESDYFAGVSVKAAKKFDLGATYIVFLSPPHNFKPERNIEFKVAYDDRDLLGAYALHPYGKLFWAVAGDSTVVLGRKGKTYDVELGAAPAREIPVASGYSVNLSLPTFFTLGGPGFFGDDETVGVFSIGPVLTAPLKFIPARLGNWSMSAGLAYFHLYDDNLVRASQILGNGARRDHWVETLRLGVNF